MYEPGTRLTYGALLVTLPGKVRPTSRGIATIGCKASALGVRPQVLPFHDPDAAYKTIESMRELLDGCERWQIDVAASGEPIEDWVLEKQSGPYRVEELPDDQVRLTCACGWAGKSRAWRARRRLHADHAAHRCLDRLGEQGVFEPDV